ncbi:aspartate/glutamate racemase family protein [Alkalicoccobacillus porphyridii]|uniref:Aspartate/glutamate racemase family protein n=1 Tax=Alkalicoccobacillus porphyridii TaxID=2597270 RepID=A0A554A0M2_9BACI|nr:aspartate/glutamate racemase family protein [Alkalicoccobacillus porphyridii]TSB47241.1 aspartate/glutamate racemase family protein [Alkalicoccobacillus porphyridii]
MKTIGFIGGLSWESTADYYRYVNEYVKEELGGLHSAKCLLHSFDFQEIVQLQKLGHWEEATARMVDAAKKLEGAGADLIVICTNTMHLMADEIEKQTSIPLIHIADAVAVAIKKANMSRIGLLGTAFTMEKTFYKDRLATHGIECLIPGEEDRKVAHDIIFSELCRGEILEESKISYQQIIQQLKKDGAQGVILGCTEIPLLIKQTDSPLPVFDSTRLHAEAAVRFAMETALV